MSKSEQSFWRRGFRITGSSLACLAAISLAATPAMASVEGEMNSYFNSSGAAVNVTGPSAFEGQSAGYYSGGSLWTRFPTKQINPVNLQLPRASGGCGGIDLFGGSFSFINTDEIVATLKATANNAIGFAFQLAIDSISAQIGGVMKDMAHKIQQMNEFNMNSCQLAQEAVGELWPAMDGASRTICQNIGRSTGLFSDEARARHDCQNQSARNQTTNGSTDPQAELAKSKNYTWNALMANSAIRPTTDYGEWLMTMVGTIIYIKPETEGAGGTFRFIAPASWDTYTALLDGTAVASAQIWRCDNGSDPYGCLNPTPTPLGIGQNVAYKARVKAMMQSIAGKINSNTALDSDEINLLGLSSIPIYKIMVVNAASQFGLSAGELDSLSEIVAVEVLLGHIDRMLEDVTRAQIGMQTLEQENFAQWRAQVKDVRERLGVKRGEMSGRLNDTYQIIQRSQLLETTLKNTMSPQISASLRFGRGLSAQGIR